MARAIALITAFIGGLVLLGWMFDIAALKSVLPGLATMKANTALCFLLAGLLLFLRKIPSPFRKIVPVIAGLVAIIALLTLAQYIVGWNLGIDELIFSDPETPPHEFPGRMSLATAAMFLLAGISLVLLNYDNHANTIIGQFLAVTVGFSSLLVLAGYAYDVESLYHIGIYSSVALHTAVLFFILSCAILLAGWNKGIMAFFTTGSSGGATTRYMFALAVVWSIVIAGSLIWNIAQVKRNTLKKARLQAKVAYQRDVLYRAWNSKHGGVYVPVTEETPPNPYLSEIPERDITTPAGKLLTLMNHAYMSRQVYELAKKDYGIIGHLTALNPIRSENAPDEWEREALIALEQSKQEVGSVENIEGSDYMRLMKPLIAEESCLQCHAAQGYTEGDIYGGISVSIPMEPVWAGERAVLIRLFFGYGAVWLMGLWGLVLVARRLGRSHAEVLHAKRFTENIVATVPSGLVAIGKPARLSGSGGSGGKSDVISVNRSFCELFDVRQQDAIGKNIDEVLQTIGLSEEYRAAVAVRKPFWNLEGTCSTASRGKLTLNLTLSGIRVAEEEEEEEEEELLLVIDDITERKQAEVALKHSEEFLKTVFNSTNDQISIIDVHDFKIVGVNRAFLEKLGLKEEEVIGNTCYAITHHRTDPCTPPNDVCPLMDTVNTGDYSVAQHVHYIKSGEKIYAEVSTSPIKDENGRVIQVVHVVRDITERVRFEKELAKSKSYTESIIKNFLDTLIVVDTEARIKTVNPETCSLLGYTEEELLGQPVRNIFAAEEEEEEVKALFQFFRHRDKSSLVARMEIRNMSLTYVTKDGRKIPMSFNASLLTDDQGNITGVVAGAKDITDIKRAEEALRSSEERYRTLFEESQDVVFISTPEGSFIDINPAGVELFGYGLKEELLRVDIAGDLYWNPDKYEEYKRMMQQHGYIQDYQLEVKTKDGKKLIVLETANSVRDKDGNIVAYRGFIRDITAQKVLEEQLRHTQKMESLGTLAAGIAHDFNNILGIIMGHSTLLETIKFDPEIFQQSTEAITKASQRGAALVKQLLTFARKTEAIFGTVHLNDSITEIEKLMREAFPKTIVVCTELQEGLSPIYADATQIHQVLLNLCVNARDAMPRGGTLSISTKTLSGESLASKYPKAEARDYVEIRVSDTGMGMDEATRQRIFEPFFTTKGVGKGTGLGLSLVYSMVEQHNGFLSVESEPGKGTTFTVYLPAEERAPESFQPLKEAAEEVSGGTETILVVEDEEMIRELLKTVLLAKGYTVLTAEDGAEALQMYLAHQKEIAVVISDVGLPKMSGDELFRRIKDADPKPRVILATGFIDPQQKAELFKAGVKYIIQKPYLANEVLQKIRDVIDAENE